MCSRIDYGHCRLRAGLLNDTASVQTALRNSKLSITQAFLLPYDAKNQELPEPTIPIEPVVVAKLRRVEPASSLHLAIVEIVRRQYELACKAIDRADKERIRAAHSE